MLLLFASLAASAPPADESFLSALPAGWSFSRASTAPYHDATGALVTAAIDQPRFDHDPVTHEPLGLLLEPADAGSGRAADILTMTLPDDGFPGATGWTVAVEFVPLALPT